MSDITRIETGPRMSQAVIHNGVVYLAGQISDKGPSVTEQTADVLAQIDDLLAQAGTDKSRILTATIILSDISTFGEMNAVWEKWVPQGATPARATIEAKLAAPQYLVEIVVVAAVA